MANGSRPTISLAVAVTVFALITPAPQAAAAAANGLEKYRNQVSISYDPTSGACFDDLFDAGPCLAFSGVALQLAGVTPGAEIEVDGITFVWPDTTSGQPDSMTPDGQKIPVKPPAGTNTLALLGASHNGPLSTTVELSYSTPNSKGKYTDKEFVPVPDWWTLGSGAAAANEIRTPFQVLADAVPVAVEVSVWAVTVSVDPTRRLVSVAFPGSNSDMCFFDLQLVKD